MTTNQKYVLYTSIVIAVFIACFLLQHFLTKGNG